MPFSEQRAHLESLPSDWREKSQVHCMLSPGNIICLLPCRVENTEKSRHLFSFSAIITENLEFLTMSWGSVDSN